MIRWSPSREPSSRTGGPAGLGRGVCGVEGLEQPLVHGRDGHPHRDLCRGRILSQHPAARRSGAASPRSAPPRTALVSDRDDEPVQVVERQGVEEGVPVAVAPGGAQQIALNRHVLVGYHGPLGLARGAARVEEERRVGCGRAVVSQAFLCTGGVLRPRWRRPPDRDRPKKTAALAPWPRRARRAPRTTMTVACAGVGREPPELAGRIQGREGHGHAARLEHAQEGLEPRRARREQDRDAPAAERRVAWRSERIVADPPCPLVEGRIRAGTEIVLDGGAAAVGALRERPQVGQERGSHDGTLRTPARPRRGRGLFAGADGQGGEMRMSSFKIDTGSTTGAAPASRGALVGLCQPASPSASLPARFRWRAGSPAGAAATRGSTTRAGHVLPLEWPRPTAAPSRSRPATAPATPPCPWTPRPASPFAAPRSTATLRTSLTTRRTRRAASTPMCASPSRTPFPRTTSRRWRRRVRRSSAKAAPGAFSCSADTDCAATGDSTGFSCVLHQGEARARSPSL